MYVTNVICHVRRHCVLYRERGSQMHRPTGDAEGERNIALRRLFVASHLNILIIRTIGLQMRNYIL